MSIIKAYFSEYRIVFNYKIIKIHELISAKLNNTKNNIPNTIKH